MDQKLIAWARAVKARRRSPLPTLWFFTDQRRTPDPCAVIARLPKGFSGVVFRHDGASDRARLGARVARLCRARRIALVVTDARLAARLGAGFHFRRARNPPLIRCRGLLTTSAHNRTELMRAVRNGADLVFLSAAFPTASHPGAAALGACRWNALARASLIPVAALGGVGGASVLRLRAAAAAAAIGALT